MNYFNRIQDKHTYDALKQVVDALNQLRQQDTETTASIKAMAVAPPDVQHIQQQLQAGGTVPLNVTGLTGAAPAGGTAVYETAGLTAGILVLGADGAKIQTLGTQGTDHKVLHGATSAGAFPTFSAVDLTLDVSGILPVANGGTNANTAAGARTSLGAAASGGVGANTVTLAKITGGGTDGSLTWNADGCITSFVAPT